MATAKHPITTGTCVIFVLLVGAVSAGRRSCNPATSLNRTTDLTDLSLQDHKFSCGGSGEVLKIQSASTNQALGTACNVSESDLKKYFADGCNGKEECTIRVKQYAGCALQVVAKCDDAGLDVFTVLILVLIFVIILAMGTTCRWEDFVEIWRTKKRAFVVGWSSQFGFMPLFAYCMALAFNFQDLVSVGVVLCGAAPGGTTSNLFTYWAGGNVPLSIAMSLASTVCAVFMLPLLAEIYIMTTFTEGLVDGGSIRIPFKDIAIIAIVTIVVPVTLGILIRKHNTEMKLGGKFIYKWVEIGGSVIGGLFLVAAVVVGIKDNPDLMKPSMYSGEWVLAAIFQPVGCIFGFVVASLLKLDGRDRVAVALETGVQNYTLVIGICALTYSGCTRVEALTFVLISSLWYVISSAWIVGLLHVAGARGWIMLGQSTDADVTDAAAKPASIDVNISDGGGSDGDEGSKKTELTSV